MDFYKEEMGQLPYYLPRTRNSERSGVGEGKKREFREKIKRKSMIFPVKLCS